MFSFEALYGCPGFITEGANFAPELSYSVYEAAVAGDFGKLSELADAMAPLFSFGARVTANHGPHTGVGAQGGYMGLAIAHAAMDIVGLRGGEVRLPLVGLTDEEKAELRDVLKTMKVIK